MKKRKERKKKFAKQLLGYSATAGAALAMGSTPVSAAIVYTPANITVTEPGFEFSEPIDLDGNSVPDLYAGITSMYMPPNNMKFQFVIGTGLIANSMKPIALPGASTSATSFPFAQRLANGDLINSTLFDSNATSGGIIGMKFSASYYGSVMSTMAGNFIGQRGYVGVKFGDTEDYFAWIDIEASADLSSFTIHGWAYENEAGTSIAAGATASVPLPGSLALLASGAAGLLAHRARQRKNESQKEKVA